MANSFEIVKYKQQIGALLIQDEDIVRLIDNKDIESPEDLIGQNIYNFARHPQSIEDETTFICFEVDIPKVSTSYNYLFKKLTLTFYIICHERLMPTDDIYGGTRNDLIAARIDKIFNGYKGIGKVPLELISNTASAISVKHRCRTLVFSAEDLNASRCNE